MKKLFNKAAVMTDLHIGLKSNSVTHNEDCLNFVKWFISVAKIENCEIAVVCGDWHNHRASINIQSLHYSMKCLELLNSSFEQVFFLTGNHDLYYRDKRDIHSVAWANYLPNITVVNDITTIDNVTFCPWLVGDEFQKVKKISCDYAFGHFELGNFYMNSQVMMPDHENSLKISDLSNIGTVYSGHFHKRQFRDNVIYMGNAFPHNYADAGDDDRGMMILEWGKVPKFHSWPGQPRFRVYKLSEILDKPDELLLRGMHVRVNLDIDISYEESSFIREQLMPKHELREMSLIPMKLDISQDDTDYANLQFESVDNIIISQIEQLQQGSFDKQLLLDIYRNL